MNLIDKISDWIPENIRLERIWLLAKFDFATRYYGSFLGLFWALLKPLFQVAIFYTVFTFIFKNSTEHFALFLFIGIIKYQFFMESANGSLNIFRQKRYLLENIQINKLDIFYAAIGATFLGFIFNFTAFFIANLFLGGNLSWYILYFPLIVFNLLLLILATQLIFATISIFMRDIDNVWFIISTLLFWGSGIFFDLTVLPEARPLLYANPLAGILTNARYVLVYAKAPDFGLLASNFAVALLALSIGLAIFKRYSTKALEKL